MAARRQHVIRSNHTFPTVAHDDVVHFVDRTRSGKVHALVLRQDYSGSVHLNAPYPRSPYSVVRHTGDRIVGC